MATLWPLEVGKRAVADHDLILTGDDDIDKKFATEIQNLFAAGPCRPGLGGMLL
ncbi:hypothetical protein VH569_28115 [Azospirillum sp. 11R-A]|uniref:hypothetical protein n=1 Tax=Azospirillum sp. 11R-A TaxID=3111634 RepID=UPI003C1D2A40